jgi:hypothetical protein
MTRRFPRSGGGSAAALLLGIALCALAVGCASMTGHEAPPSERVSSGWRDPSALAPVAAFDAYVAGVTEALRAHRLPSPSARRSRSPWRPSRPAMSMR